MFQIIKSEDIEDNVFKLIDQDWALIAAGNKQKYNMMTASWAGMGILWGKKVVFIFIRLSRYTYKFVEESDVFSLNFFEEKYRPILNLCGTKSGGDIDKMKEPGLTSLEENNCVYFEEARLVIICKKIYYQDLIPAQFLDPKIKSNYANRDYHRMYIGEILSAYRK